MSDEKLVLELEKIGCVKFGEFRLKSGVVSPIYLDLRILVSHPKVLKKVAEKLGSIMEKIAFDRIAGIPYAGIPIAVAVGLETEKPVIYARREVKEYGTSRKIEGEFRPGETVAVMDDLITTGESKIEVIKPLEEVGLEVKDVFVIVDREQGGKEFLEQRGYALHSLVKLTELLDILEEKGRITPEQKQKVLDYLKGAKS